MKLEKENVEILKYTSDFIPDDDTIYNFIFQSEEFKLVKKQTEKYRKFLMRIWDSHQKEIKKDLDELLRFKIENNYQITFESINPSSPQVGEVVDFTIYRFYSPLVLSDSQIKLVAKRYTVIGYYGWGKEEKLNVRN